MFGSKHKAKEKTVYMNRTLSCGLLSAVHDNEGAMK